MPKKILWFVGIAVACLVIALIAGRVPSAPKTERTARIAAPLPLEPAKPAPEPAILTDNPPAPVPSTPETISPPAPPTAPKPAQTQPRKKKPELVDPLARDAMSWVGADAEAEEYWVYAINNPDIPPKEREDLIEDLNEEGFLDPKHPTFDELPLILNRLDLILELAPYAMDEVNAKSFAEAYKDLVNMAHLAADSPYGKEVK